MNKPPMCAVVHFEMPYKDRDRAAQFYEAVFGWQTNKLGPDMGDYLLVTTALPGDSPEVPPQAVLGAINGGLFPYEPGKPGQYPAVVIGVPDILAAMDRVRAAGGEVLGEPMAVPGIGDYVAYLDTEGNRNSILQPSMPGESCPN